MHQYPTQYDFLKPIEPLNVFITLAAILLILSQITFVINFFWSLFAGKVAPVNPWEANTLEWSTTSPPPHENFATTPTVYRGPYEYSSPEAAADWIPQDRQLITSSKAVLG